MTRTTRFTVDALATVLVAGLSFLLMRRDIPTLTPAAFLTWFVVGTAAAVIATVAFRFVVGFWNAAALEDRARKLRAAMTLANERAKYDPSGSVQFWPKEPIDVGVTMTAEEGGRMALLMFAQREPSRGLFVVLEPRHLPALTAAIQSIRPHEGTIQ